LQYKYIVLTNTTIAAFMAFLDSNIVVISLPVIARELPGTTAFDAVWFIMGYSIITATFLLTLGRIADIFGRVRLYKLGFAVFTIGSGLCSISWNGPSLVAFRMVQGLGGALIFANNNAILTDAFPVTERGRAIGTNQVVGIAGSVIALVAGGLLTSTLGWRSIFWINLPVGGFATLWAHKRLRELSHPQRQERMDYMGNMLFGPGLGLFLFGSTLGAFEGYDFLHISLAVAGLILIAAFLYVETGAVNPMLDLKLFRIVEFSGGAFSNLLTAVSRGGLSLILVLYLQGALLLSPLRAGIELVPFSLAFVTAGPLSGLLSDRYGPKIFVTSGILVGSVGLLLFALLPEAASYPELVTAMVLSGLGGGMFAAPNLASIMNSVPAVRRGVASGMSSLLFNVGSLLSISLTFILMAYSVPRPVLDAIFSGVAVGGNINLPEFSHAMKMVFFVLALLNTLALIPTALRWGGRKVRDEAGRI
jgi:EmrB/QacA subfamily drug resistance transporter